MPSYVVTRAPGKINLQLSVGPLQADGYHPVATVFQAVSLFDDVRISCADKSGISLKASGKVSELLPLDKNNLAFKAAELMCKKFEITDGLEITLTKEIPIAGGMAGGSADAGATIVGIDALFGLGLSRSEMEKIGSELGADIPFTISGGTAIGTGRGDQITPVLSRGNYNWVLALSSSGLSTPAVYQECDRLREGLQVAPPHISDSLMQALSAGDAVALGKALSNDLQPAACSLKPALRLILDVGMDYGALGGLVSGSGPTVAFLAENEDHALDLVVALTSSGVVGNVVRAAGPVPGARVIESA
ncbi:MAG: 4-(cytidine 5'-diphospho)-2-C-methyl-D-erythritol kinase [Candidatus Nanopelagicaceae bacterium]|nr:4-(cytidine 5'-diphospho)-2-C-methyl-D-erythritol kinase [Candidatus Nanopelagicaceae bacterium]